MCPQEHVNIEMTDFFLRAFGFHTTYSTIDIVGYCGNDSSVYILYIDQIHHGRIFEIIQKHSIH